MKCKNCNHLLWGLSGMFDGHKGDVEHWNRPYEKGYHRYTYSGVKCHADNCICIKPEILK